MPTEGHLARSTPTPTRRNHRRGRYRKPLPRRDEPVGWRHLAATITLLAAAVILIPESAAIPHVVADTLGPVGFARGSTVTVYIEQDPFARHPTDPVDRVPSAEDGVLQWKDSLKTLGNVDLRVVRLDANGRAPATGNAPDDTQPGTVRLNRETPEPFKAAGHDGVSAYGAHARRASDRRPVASRDRA